MDKNTATRTGMMSDWAARNPAITITAEAAVSNARVAANRGATSTLQEYYGDRRRRGTTGAGSTLLG